MQLSKQERRVLINQYEILKRLDPENAGHYEYLIRILVDGYTVFYDSLDLDEEMTQGECRAVTDVLDMYRSLESFYEDNTGWQAPNMGSAHFIGFDGNSESRARSFARFLGEDDRYAESNLTLNSHMPATEMYARMVAVWDGAKDKWSLLGSEVEAILAAAVHPESVLSSK